MDWIVPHAARLGIVSLMKSMIVLICLLCTAALGEQISNNAWEGRWAFSEEGCISDQGVWITLDNSKFDLSVFESMCKVLGVSNERDAYVFFLKCETEEGSKYARLYAELKNNQISFVRQEGISFTPATFNKCSTIADAQKKPVNVSSKIPKRDIRGITFGMTAQQVLNRVNELNWICDTWTEYSRVTKTQNLIAVWKCTGPGGKSPFTNFSWSNDNALMIHMSYIFHYQGGLDNVVKEVTDQYQPIKVFRDGTKKPPFFHFELGEGYELTLEVLSTEAYVLRLDNSAALQSYEDGIKSRREQAAPKPKF